MVIIPANTIFAVIFSDRLTQQLQLPTGSSPPCLPCNLITSRPFPTPRKFGRPNRPTSALTLPPVDNQNFPFLFILRLFWFIKAPHATFDWSRPILCQAKGTIRLWMYNVRVQIGALNSNTITFLHISAFDVPQRNQNKMWHAHLIKMNSICSAGL